jgi:hypothetical protein
MSLTILLLGSDVDPSWPRSQRDAGFGFSVLNAQL